MKGAPIHLRCRTNTGQHALNDLTSESTFLDLKALLFSIPGVGFQNLRIKAGFPPSVIDGDDDQLLCDYGLKSGDTIIVEAVDECLTSVPSWPSQKQQAYKHSPQYLPSSSQIRREAKIMRKVVPADNSCLFSSINFCLTGALDKYAAAEMRRVVADNVLSRPEVYSEAMLGKLPHDYASWIKNHDSWGGAIELSILSSHLSVEMDVVDVQHARVERFGENMRHRILLIYDGIHYDPLYEEGDAIRTVFPAGEDDVLVKALELAEREKAQRMYVDTSSFNLRCLVCNKGLIGQSDAIKHAEESGHTNFHEF